MKSLVTVLIPSYNEQDVLEPLHKRLVALADAHKDTAWEFLFVNDGSTDRTFETIEAFVAGDERFALVNLSRNYGKEIAMLAGLDHARGDAVVIIDADLQDPPELIPEMIEWWQKGYDDVYARRRSRNGETWLKKVTSSLYYRILQSSTRVEVQVDTGDFRLLSRRAVDALRQYRESERNTKALFSLIGYRKKEIYYDRDPRVAGETKWNYANLVDLAIDGITSFTTTPLRVATISGGVVSMFAFGYIAYLLIRPLFGVPTGDGYSSLMAAILFLGGVQLLSLGVIGEYVGRIFKETKQRPLYLVDEYKTSAQPKKKSDG